MRENLSSGFPTRSDTNQHVHNYMEDGKTLEISNLGRREIAVCPVVYRSYCKADLLLCFSIGKNPVFS